MPSTAGVALGALDVVLLGVDGPGRGCGGSRPGSAARSRSTCRSGSQRSERMNAFEQCVKTSSTSIRSPSFGVFPSTARGLEQLGVGGERSRGR